MKKIVILLVIAFLSMSIICKAQGPRLASDKSLAITIFHGYDGHYDDPIIFCKHKDTLFNGRTYQVGMPNYTYESGNRFYLGVNLKSLDRQRSNGSDSSLWYDFNLKAGDTFNFKIEKAQYIVDSVVSRKSPDGRFRKYFYFKNKRRWIEGIGETAKGASVFSYGFNADLLAVIDSAGLAYLDTSSAGVAYGYSKLIKGKTLARALDSCLYSCNGNHLSPLTEVNNLNNFNPEIELYPNPVINALNLTARNFKDKTIQCEIYDLFGRILMTFRFQPDNTQSMNLSPLQTGIYIVSITTENGYKTQKRILKN